MNKGLLSVILMLTVATFIASLTFAEISWLQGGERPDVMMVVSGACFGLISVPLWPTYIPAIAFTPGIMKKVAAHPKFFTLPLSAFILLSFLAGAILGSVVVLPITLMTLSDKSILWAFNWTLIGSVSGSVTSCMITLIYRLDPI